MNAEQFKANSSPSILLGIYLSSLFLILLLTPSEIVFNVLFQQFEESLRLLIRFNSLLVIPFVFFRKFRGYDVITILICAIIEFLILVLPQIGAGLTTFFVMVFVGALTIAYLSTSQRNQYEPSSRLLISFLLRGIAFSYVPILVFHMGLPEITGLGPAELELPVPVKHLSDDSE